MTKREATLDIVRRAQVMQTDILQQAKPACIHIDTQHCDSLRGIRHKDEVYGVTIHFFHPGGNLFYSFGLGGDFEIEEMTEGLDLIREIINNL